MTALAYAPSERLLRSGLYPVKLPAAYSISHGVLMRIAILADIHGNVLALEAVMADLENRKIDRFVNLGDSVSGPLWPRETAELLIRLNWPTVRGNHDRWVTDWVLEKQYRSDAFACQSLDPSQLAWLRAVPATLEFDNIFACHGRPGDDNAYLLENVQDGRLTLARRAEIAERVGSVASRIVLCAHSHLPSAVAVGEKMIINPGSVGLPAYEDSSPPAHLSESGSPVARCAVLHLDEDRAVVEHIAIPYDHAAAVRRAEDNESPVWAHFLSTGFARTFFTVTPSPNC
jgi:putative phosphoesterase